MITQIMLLNNSILWDFCYLWFDFFNLSSFNINTLFKMIENMQIIFILNVLNLNDISYIIILKYSIYFLLYFYSSLVFTISYIIIIYNKILIINYFINYIIINKSIYVLFVFNNSLIYNFKFFLSILFLIFIRAGIPRYRYDFLTKLGWIKFFSYTLYFFIFIYIIFILI